MFCLSFAAMGRLSRNSSSMATCTRGTVCSLLAGDQRKRNWIYRSRSPQLFRKLTEIDPRDAEGHYLIGDDLAVLWKKKAIAHGKRLELDPEHAEALYHLSQMLAAVSASGSSLRETVRTVKKKAQYADRAKSPF